MKGWEVGLLMGEERRRQTTIKWNLVKNIEESLMSFPSSAFTQPHFDLDCRSHSASLLCYLSWPTGRKSDHLLFLTPSGCRVGLIRIHGVALESWFSLCFGLKMCSTETSVTETRHNKQRDVKTTEIHGTGCTGGRFHTSTCPCIRWALSCWAALKIFLWCPSRFTPRFWTSLKERADQPWTLV